MYPVSEAFLSAYRRTQGDIIGLEELPRKQEWYMNFPRKRL